MLQSGTLIIVFFGISQISFFKLRKNYHNEKKNELRVSFECYGNDSAVFLKGE